MAYQAFPASEEGRLFASDEVSYNTLEVSKGSDESGLLGERATWYLDRLLLPSLIFLVGVVFLCASQGWSVIESVYVVVQIITTVGYGDLIVSGTATRLFMVFYVLVVLFLLAYNLQMVVDFLLELELRIISQHLRALSSRNQGRSKEDPVSKETSELTSAILMFTSFIVLGTVLFAAVDPPEKGVGLSLSLADTLYMSVVTATTLGFGDMHPLTDRGRALASFWMLFAVGSFANLLARLCAYLYERRRSAKLMTKDSVIAIDEAKFKAIDRDGNGAMSRGEFIAWTALRLDLVSEEFIAAVNEEYDNLDKDKTNVVSLADIIARQKEYAASNQGARQSSMSQMMA